MSKTARRVVITLLLLLSLAAAVAVGMHYLPKTDDPTPDNTAANGHDPRIPDLGSRGKPMATPTPDNGKPDGTETTETPTDTAEQPQTPPEVLSSEREIDILLHNLAVATRAGNRKGVALNQDALAQARPSELVDSRVQAAIELEQNAVVRIQYFLAFHSTDARRAWAWSVHDTRGAKLSGGDTLYSGGEVDELSLIAAELFSLLMESWHDSGDADVRLVNLLRNVLDTEKPAWLLDVARSGVLVPLSLAESADAAQRIELELRRLLERRTAETSVLSAALLVWLRTFDPVDAALVDIERPELRHCAALLVSNYPPRNLPYGVHLQADWLKALLAGDGVPSLVERLLRSDMSTDDKRQLIHAVATREISNGRAMIEAGLTRKDANYPDCLTAFGAFLRSTDDLQRLAAAAEDGDPNNARGAIEGLRRSPHTGAEAELRRLLEQGSDTGVKSLALGALLSRTVKPDALLDEYLEHGKDASLRAVAVAHIPATNPARMRSVLQDDPSPRVRQAALARLAEQRPESDVERKDLQFFFQQIADRDSSPVIRSAARKHAEDLAK